MKVFTINEQKVDPTPFSYKEFNANEYTLTHLKTGEKVLRECKIKIGYDENNLYFKFFCPYDAPFRRVYKSYNTSVYRGDCVEIFLSPTGDIKEYYEFDLSPFNGLCALKIQNHDFYNISVDLLEKSPIFTRTEILDKHYEAHYKIPLINLGINKNAKDLEVRFNCFRIDKFDKKKRVSQALCPTGSKTHHDSRVFGKMQFN